MRWQLQSCQRLDAIIVVVSVVVVVVVVVICRLGVERRLVAANAHITCLVHHVQLQLARREHRGEP